MRRKWIDIVPGAQLPGRKTKRWMVIAKHGRETLGFIEWYSPWRQYCFFPKTGTLYERQCLRDIADFCDTETTAHFRAARAEKAAKKGQ